MSEAGYARMTSLAVKDGRVTPVTIEVKLEEHGIGVHLVGLSDIATKETLLRTVTALTSSGYSCPGQKIMINVAPYDVRRHTAGTDLALALCLLAASGQMPADSLDGCAAAGELGLDGSVRNCYAALTDGSALSLPDSHLCIVPKECPRMTGKGIPAGTLKEAVRILSKNKRKAL